MPETAMAMDVQTFADESIQKGSLSFSFASRLFLPSVRQKVVKLYAWCRYVDDQIDDESIPVEQRKWRLDRIAEQSFDPMESSSSLPMAIKAFRELRDDIDLPRNYPEDLLLGMKMDLDREVYESLESLELYCYRVAGVVGLMMCRVMGVRNDDALKHANDLGLAMQLTNISRDVLTDARMGRIYLPLAWLRESGIPLDPKSFEDEGVKRRLVPLVEKLLKRADELYLSGDKGLRDLDFRSAIAVAIAREVYSAIGTIVRKRREKAWDQRSFTTLPYKIKLAVKGIFRAAMSRLEKQRSRP